MNVSTQKIKDLLDIGFDLFDIRSSSPPRSCSMIASNHSIPFWLFQYNKKYCIKHANFEYFVTEGIQLMASTPFILEIDLFLGHIWLLRVWRKVEMDMEPKN